MGVKVFGVDKMTYASNLDLLPVFQKYQNFNWLPFDINDLEKIEECDFIINTAAESHVDNSIENSVEFLNSNVYGVYHLLTVLRRLNPRPTFLQFSTDEVYGDIPIGSHTEKDILKPSNPYSSTKASADMLILECARTYEIPYVIVRPTNNYGTYQYPEKLIPRTCKAIMKKEKFPLHENGTPKRTWVNVEDVTDAIVHIIKNKLKNQIFNISGNYEDTNLNVVKKIVHHITGTDDINPYCEFGTSRAGQDVRYSLDASLLKNFGWNNKRIFDNELPEVVNHYKERYSTCLP
jgi:dTDP-glucose 4,6-dehydratase